MTEFAIAELIVDVLRGYALIGAVVGLAFLTIGLDRLVPSARGAYLFRALLAPGLILLWPLVALRWSRLESGQRHGG